MPRVRRTSFRFEAMVLAVLIVLAPGRPARADVKACLDGAESSQGLRARGQLVEAKRGFIACAAASCPAQVRADCTRWLAEIEQALPSIVIRVHDADGRDAIDVTALLDGQSAAVDGRPVELNPGKHVIRVLAPGRTALDEPIVVRQAERDRIVSIALGPRPTAQRDSPAAPARAPVPLASWLFLGAGTASLGTGIVLAVLGSAAHGDLESSCARTSSCAHEDIASARTKLIAGDVLMGLGVVAVGVGLYLAFTRGPHTAMASTAWRF